MSERSTEGVTPSTTKARRFMLGICSKANGLDPSAVLAAEARRAPARWPQRLAKDAAEVGDGDEPELVDVCAPPLPHDVTSTATNAAMQASRRRRRDGLAV